MAETCGASNGAVTCDRNPEHIGPHRGFTVDKKPVFWMTPRTVEEPEPRLPFTARSERNVPLATELRDRGIARAGAHASPVFTDTALEVVRALVLQKPELTTDDVWEELDRRGCHTREGRALGSVMRQAASEGLIEPTDTYRQSERVACHRRPLRVWKRKSA